MTLGQRLRQLRKAHGWTQQDLARVSSIAQGIITNIETGRTPNPTAQTVQRLADALDVPVDTLLSEAPGPDLSHPPIEQARAIGIPQADLDALQRRWPAWSEARRRDYLRQVETAQRQQAQLRALTEDDDPGAPTQAQILAGVS